MDARSRSKPLTMFPKCCTQFECVRTIFACKTNLAISASNEDTCGLSF